MNYEQLTEYRSNEALKEELTRNNFIVNIGIHGQIFVTPINKGAMYKREFINIIEAYNYYNKYLIA